MKKIFPLVIILFLGCHKPIDWTLHPSGKKYPVFEAILTNEYKNQEIRVRYSYEDLNGSSEGIDNAEIFVSDGENIYIFTVSDSTKGLYISEEKFGVCVNKIYTFNALINQNQYSSRTNTLPVSPIDTIIWERDTNGLYYLKFVAPIFNPIENSMYQIFIDWSFIEGYTDKGYEETHALLYAFTLTSFDLQEFFSPKGKKIYFPSGTKINVKKYSMTPEFADFIRSVLIESRWRGTLFDFPAGNVPTNIEGNNAKGFFTACSVTEKTFIVN